MNNFDVTLPDGSVRSVPPGTRPIDVAKQISQRLADDAIVARVNGGLWDLTRPLEADAKLEILTTRNPEASWRTGIRPRTCWWRRCWSCSRKPLGSGR